MYIIKKIFEYGREHIVDIFYVLVAIGFLITWALAINYLLQKRPERANFEKTYNDKCLELESLQRTCRWAGVLEQYLSDLEKAELDLKAEQFRQAGGDEK